MNVMTTLTPRYEAITGAVMTGFDGTTGRTYVLANPNFYSVIEFIKQGSPLHETLDFSVVGNTVTFSAIVFDADVLGLRYFTSDGSAIISAGYAYVATNNVYTTAGITSSEISTTDVAEHISRAETIICRMTKNIYWKIGLDKQSITSATNDSITQTGAGWTPNDLTDLYIWVYSGTNSGQIRKIVSNTSDTITVDRNWTANPDNTGKFKVFYVPADFDPRLDIQIDGSGLKYQFLPYYPVNLIESLAIGATPVTVTPSNLYVYQKTGKIQLKVGAEASVFSNIYPQEVDIQYWYGVDTLPLDIKRLVELHAAMQILAEQMGGTFDDPSTVTLPEMSVSVGQAYINIRSSLETMKEEYDELINKYLRVWPVFG
jgi:hypothetical protein